MNGTCNYCGYQDQAVCLLHGHQSLRPAQPDTRCPAWADGEHCYEADYLGEKLVSKVCACGAEVRRT